ncbi:MAG: hypothetical protein Q9211_001817 [Gyalolechia sp. 1 TL-2023]
MTTDTPLIDGATTSSADLIPPVAVIGLAGRFPGEATDARSLWNLCCEGQSAWSEIPKQRFSAEAYRHPNPSKIGCFNSKGAHFLTEDVGLFDAAFFGISPVEAKAMDPQQRLLLETTYEAMENAGATLEGIAGSNTGVYVGASQMDYSVLLLRDTQDIPVYHSTGNSANILSNRLSYIFNLKGPSWTMDTACSSSLAALHAACQSLRTGEIDQAIVGGAHIMLNPDTMVTLSMLKYLIPNFLRLDHLLIHYRLFGDDGRSYTYDSRASGYGRGEGVVSLILKPLSKAVHDGDNIRAVIRNTGVNQDGKTAGMTFPSCDAQASLIRSVYNAAGLDPLETDYVEAHGTGTAAGDPIEAEAIARSMTKSRDPAKPLIVGSVKSNIGHLEAASGLAAMVKTIMALEEGIIPPNCDFRTPNKNIPMDAWKIKVPTSVQPWPDGKVQRASISNFGFGGTNVHVILEKYLPASEEESEQRHLNGDRAPNSSRAKPHTDGQDHNRHRHPSTLLPLSKLKAAQHPGKSFRRRLFVLSAKDRASLKTRTKQLATYLERHRDVDPELLALTLNEKRSQLEWREAISAVTSSELCEILTNDQADYEKPSGEPRLGFVFTGQGAQWANMGMGLLTYPVFAQTLHKADGVLQNLGAKWSLLDELIKDSESSRLHQPLLSQPTTTALQIALVDLLSTWDIHPFAVVGHSSGEIAAAYAARALSLADCMLIAYQRGLLAESLKDTRPDRPGGMLAIGASPAKVRPMLKRLGSAHAVVACVNAPSLVTASGDERAMTRLQTVAEDASLLHRRLKVDVAYHSPHMSDIAEQYLRSISTIVPQPATSVRFHSSVKGELVPAISLTADYWVENMTSPVQFLDGVQSMYGQAPGPDVLIELGPHSTLEAPLRDIMKANPKWSSKVRYFPTLVRNKDAVTTALSMAAALHVLGASLDLSAINQVDPTTLSRPLPGLPAYPWNHSKRHWHESRLSVNHRHKPFPRSDLLGLLVDDYNLQELRWRNILRLTDLPWLSDHNVQGSVVFPLTGYLAMALEAVFQHASLHNLPITTSTSYKLREVQVSRSIVLSEEVPTEISFVLRPRNDGTRGPPPRSWLTFTVYSWTLDNGWNEHCQGLIKLAQEDEGFNPVNGPRYANLKEDRYKSIMSAFRSACQESLDPAKIYSRFSSGGLRFGPAFQNITAAWVALDRSIGTVVVPNTAKDMPNEEENIFCIHPRTFDACFQCGDFATDPRHMNSSAIQVPVFVKEITVKSRLLHRPEQELHVYAQKHRPLIDNEAETHASFIVASSDDPSDVLIDVLDSVGSRLPTMSEDQPTNRSLCYQMAWAPCTDLLSSQQFTATFPPSDADPLPSIMKLERGAFYYMQRLLQSTSAEELDDAPEHYRKLYATIVSLCRRAEHGDLPFQTMDWLQCTREAQESYLTDLAKMDDCGRLLCAVGANLLPIIEEDVQPLAIMQHQNKLEKYYESHGLLRRGSAVAAAVVSSLAFQNPNMRILEIGRGLYAATESILQALGSRFASYHFTDISTESFDKAKEVCSEWSDKMRYTRLDIEKEPLAQGFDVGSYDLVVASNVLHNAANMTATMKNVRSLLRTGGKVLLGEPTAILLSATVIFGTLPGWWRGDEPEREFGPSLSEGQWHTVLKRTGFSGIDGSVALLPDGPDSASVMLSTAVPERLPARPKAAVLTCGPGKDRLAQSVGEHIGSTTTGDLLQVELDGQYGIVLALDEVFWSNVTEDGLRKMQELFASARGLLWVTQGSQAAKPGTNMVTGLARIIRAENTGFRFVTLDLEEASESHMTDTIVKLFEHCFEMDNHTRFFDENEFVEIDGALHITRALPDPKKDQYVVRETCGAVPEPQPFHQPDRPLKLDVGRIGLLDSIRFTHDEELLSALGPNDVEIAVAAVGMNFIDIMMSLGQIPPSRKPGQECSGTINAVGKDVRALAVGDRVCALASGSYGNMVRTSQHWAVKIPPAMSFHHAASIPVIFCTAYFALMDVGRLSAGESVLIHAAAGGVGQAAIMLASRAGADVYVTVGSTEKKNLMMEEYGIPEDRIFSSRDSSFAVELMAMTGNRGIDIVLNSTSGDILHQSWQCLAPLGRFLEIGKRDFVQNSGLEMNKFLQSVTFSGVDLGVFAQNRPPAFQRMLSEMIDMHSRQILEPIKPLNVFPISQLQQAMRMMQSGKHIGKIIIDCSGDDVVQAMPAPSPKAVKGNNASYLITGGTGGIGRSITRWLAREGATNIVLASRSGPDQRGIAELVQELQGIGVKVFVDRCDVADLAQVKSLVSKCQDSMPPIRGVIHGAMALRDALFEKISHTDWTLNIKPRMQGAWNLHHALLDSKLDFFVMLASVAGIVGNPGQSAYAASNTFLDSFAAYRNRLGLPASSIDIGIVESVGWAAENMAKTPNIADAAHDRLTEAELLALIKAAITNPIPGCSFQQTVTGLKLQPGKKIPGWAARDAKFAHLLHDHQTITAPAEQSGNNESTTRQLLQQAETLESAIGLVCEATRQRLSSLLMIPVEDVEIKKPVVAYGLDSLAAVEIRNWIASGLESTVPLIELMNSPSIENLAGKIANKSRLINKALFPVEDGAPVAEKKD